MAYLEWEEQYVLGTYWMNPCSDKLHVFCLNTKLPLSFKILHQGSWTNWPIANHWPLHRAILLAYPRMQSWIMPMTLSCPLVKLKHKSAHLQPVTVTYGLLKKPIENDWNQVRGLTSRGQSVWATLILWYGALSPILPAHKSLDSFVAKILCFIEF